MLEAHHDWNIYDIAAHLPEEHRVHPCTVYRIWKRHQLQDQSFVCHVQSPNAM